MSRPCTVFVPATVAIAYTADRGWHAVAAPPAWWVEELQDGQPHGHGGTLTEAARPASDLRPCRQPSARTDQMSSDT